MNGFIPIVVALHGDTDHGIANPWLLIPAGTLAAIYYIVVGIGGWLKGMLARAIAPGHEDRVTIGGVKVEALRRRITFHDVVVADPAGAPSGSSLSAGSVEFVIAGRSTGEKRLDLGSLRLVGVTISVPREGRKRRSRDGGATNAWEDQRRHEADGTDAGEWMIRAGTVEVGEVRIVVADEAPVTLAGMEDELRAALADWCPPRTAVSRVVTILTRAEPAPA